MVRRPRQANTARATAISVATAKPIRNGAEGPISGWYSVAGGSSFTVGRVNAPRTIWSVDAEMLMPGSSASSCYGRRMMKYTTSRSGREVP